MQLNSNFESKECHKILLAHGNNCILASFLIWICVLLFVFILAKVRFLEFTLRQGEFCISFSYTVKHKVTWMNNLSRPITLPFEQIASHMQEFWVGTTLSCIYNWWIYNTFAWLRIHNDIKRYTYNSKFTTFLEPIRVLRLQGD